MFLELVKMVDCANDLSSSLSEQIVLMCKFTGVGMHTYKLLEVYIALCAHDLLGQSATTRWIYAQ